MIMAAHEWDVHDDDSACYGRYGDYHHALSWMYRALDGLSGAGWGMLRTADGQCWRADRGEDGEIRWTRL